MKKKTLLLVGEAAAFVLALVCMFLPFATGVSWTGNFLGATGGSSVSEYGLIFGNSNFPSNGALIMSWVFVLLGLLGIAAAFVLPIVNNKFAKLSALILACSALLILIGSIIFFFTKPLQELNNASGNVGSLTYKLGFGAVGTGICGILSALAAGFSAYLTYKK